jgi:hypothetical protein
MKLQPYQLWLFGLSLNGLTACAVVNDLVGYTSTAEYVESVFKRQNAISTQVMMLPDTELSTENYETLLKAESTMQRDCQLLNDYARKEINQESISLLFKKQVKDSAKGCDLSIEIVESLLEDFDIDE